MTLPKFNRRGWLALWAQRRRRQRQIQLLPAPVLRPAYPGLLQWDWALANPYRWNVWLSGDGGASWIHVEDYWTAGANRQFAPDGGHELYFIVGVDVFGREITEHSNLARPDDAAPPTPNAPVITGGGYTWEGTEPGWFDAWLEWTFDHGSYPVAQIEIHQSVNGGPYYLAAVVSSDADGASLPQVADSETTFRYQVRYRDGTVYGPFSNEWVVDCLL